MSKEKDSMPENESESTEPSWQRKTTATVATFVVGALLTAGVSAIIDVINDKVHDLIVPNKKD